MRRDLHSYAKRTGCTPTHATHALHQPPVRVPASRGGRGRTNRDARSIVYRSRYSDPDLNRADKVERVLRGFPKVQEIQFDQGIPLRLSSDSQTLPKRAAQ